MRLGVAAALTGSAVVPGDVEVEDGRVTALGVTPAGPGGLAVPGFVDLQVNGVGGVDFLHGSAAEYATAGTALAATGVTAYRPTFITAGPDALVRVLSALAAAGPRPGAAARLLGAHLEGPFLSPAWPGAHPAALVRDPEPALLHRLLAAGPVAAMTVAPERPGGLELIAALVAAGVVVQVGHTDATAEQAHAAFDAGARAITHVFNAHRRFSARDPGPAGAALSRPGVTVTAIFDGVHLAPDTERLVAAAAGDRLALVSDMIGGGRVGDTRVTARDGVPRRADGTLAGSLVTLDAALRRLAAHGVPLPAAVHAVTTAPADLAGRPDLGRLGVGLPADITVLDDGLRVVRTLIGGDVAFSRHP